MLVELPRREPLLTRLRDHIFGTPQIGPQGERIAARFLRSRGCRVLERNWRGRTGEVDLIVRDGRTIVFVEVKTRAEATPEPGFAAVGAAKQRQIARAAAEWWQRHRRAGWSLRFDVIVVLLSDDRCQIDHREAAFESPLG